MNGDVETNYFETSDIYLDRLCSTIEHDYRSFGSLAPVFIDCSYSSYRFTVCFSGIDCDILFSQTYRSGSFGSPDDADQWHHLIADYLQSDELLSFIRSSLDELDREDMSIELQLVYDDDPEFVIAASIDGSVFFDGLEDCK